MRWSAPYHLEAAVVIFSALQQGNSPVPVSSRSEIHQEICVKIIGIGENAKSWISDIFWSQPQGEPTILFITSVHWIIIGYYKE